MTTISYEECCNLISQDGHLNLSKRNLTSLPNILPSTITTLDCSYNNLTTLPTYPNLITLYCFCNQLISLPEYPNLTNLVCYSNQLSYLSEYPNLVELDCSFNQLTSLPNYPMLVKNYCFSNLLDSLPFYPKLKMYLWDKIDLNLNTKEGKQKWNKRQIETNKEFMEYFEEATNRHIPLLNMLNDLTCYY